MEIRLTRVEAIIPTLATREDLAHLESKLFNAFQQFSREIHQDMVCMRQDITDLHKDMVEVHKEMTEVHQEISEVHKEISEVHKEISGVHHEISGVHREISVVHKQIATIPTAINNLTWRLFFILSGTLSTLFSAAFFIAKHVN